MLLFEYIRSSVFVLIIIFFIRRTEWGRRLNCKCLSHAQVGPETPNSSTLSAFPHSRMPQSRLNDPRIIPTYDLLPQRLPSSIQLNLKTVNFALQKRYPIKKCVYQLVLFNYFVFKCHYSNLNVCAYYMLVNTCDNSLLLYERYLHYFKINSVCSQNLTAHKHERL